MTERDDYLAALDAVYREWRAAARAADATLKVQTETARAEHEYALERANDAYRAGLAKAKATL